MQMKEKNTWKSVFVAIFLPVLIFLLLAFPAYAATTLSVLDNQISIEGEFTSKNGWGNTGSISVDNDVITAKAEGGSTAQATLVLKIKNNTSKATTITFDYSASNYSSFSEGSATGTKSIDLAPNETKDLMTIVGKKKFSSNTAQLTLSNFTYTAAAAESEVTFEYSGGAITVGGNAIANGEKTNISSTDGATLVATPSSGYSFLGWVNGNTHELLSTSASYTLVPAREMTVIAAFTSATSPAWFSVDNRYYNDLNDAATYAATTTAKRVVLAANGTLPAGDYTVPSGVTLLIPFDDANTLYTTEPGHAGGNTYTKPTSTFRTLTMAEGAEIYVAKGGIISLSAMHGTKQNDNACVSGAMSRIDMKDDSYIEVQSGGKLFAWGHITGSGSVTVKSGGSVYEYFQLEEWRGASQSTSMKNNVLPFSQYYLQNVEVPMTLEAGSIEYAYLTITVSVIGVQSVMVPVFSNSDNSMFQLTGGSLTKDYLEDQDRLLLEVQDGATLELQSYTIKVSMYSITTGDFVFPVQNNFVLNVRNGGTVQLGIDACVLPGVQMTLDEGGSLKLGSGVSVFIYDAETWKKDYVWSSSSVPFNPLAYAPGRTYTRTAEADIKDASICINGYVDASAGYVYTTAGGANVYSTTSTGKIKVNPGTATVTYQCIQKTDATTYDAIPVTPVKLLNANYTEDGTLSAYTDTTTAGTYTYSAEHGRWDKDGHTSTEEEKAPTCTTKGSETVTCTCGFSQTTDIPATGHTPGETTTTTTATCTSAGKQTVQVKCKNCDHISETITDVPATGHTTVIDAAKAPTCTATGLTEGKHCSVCNEVLVAQTTVDALGHTEVIDAAVAATCTATGLTEGKHCSVCNTVLVAQTETKATGHTAVTDAAKAPTCTGTGLTEGSHCSVCNEVLVAQTEIPAKGHTEVIDKAAAATCTSTGLTEGKHCSVCNEVLVAQTTVDALGHTEVIDAAVAATCTATGLSEGKHCSVCNEVIVAQTVVAALGHTEVVDAAVAPTCTETGLTEGKHCSVCSEVLLAQEVAAATGHTEVIDSAVSPDCVNKGKTEGKHCSVCGEVIVAQTDVDALGHTEVTDAAVSPDCVNEGKTEGKHCSVCGEVIVAQNVVPALGHTEVTDAAAAPTCTATGKTEGKHCSVCGTVTVAQTTVDALGHTVVTDAAVAATCTATGLTEGSHCSVCNEVLVAQTVVDALGHTEVTDQAVAATCTSTGLTEGKHCSVCGEVTVRQEVVSTLDHDYGEWEITKEPTCTERGTERRDCDDCDHYETREINANGHKPDGKNHCSVCKISLCVTCSPGEAVIENEVDATCTQSGSYDSVTYCTVCFDQISRETITVDALGHTEVIDQAVAATCTEKGKTEGKHCSVCSEVLVAQTEVPAKGHTEVIDEAVAATCTEKGKTEGKHCSVCNEVLVAQTEVPAKGHTEVIDAAVAATCTSTGLTEGKHCSVCGEVITAQTVTEKLSHTNETIPAVPATCTQTGLTAGVKCSVCGEILTAQTETQATGHSYKVKGDIITAGTCMSEAVYKAVCSVCGDVSTADTITGAKDPNNHTGNNTSNVNFREATCTQTGYTGDTVCECGVTVQTGEAIEKKAHTETTRHINEVSATCTKDGSYVVETYCSVCGTTFPEKNQTVTVPAKGHSYGDWEITTAATCGADGSQKRTCSTCGDVETETIPATGAHTEVIDQAVEATCTATGLTEGKHCSACNTVITAQSVVSALGHLTVVDTAKAPTCTDTGLTEGSHCSRCNEVLVAQEIVDALGHQPADPVVQNKVDSTCTAMGSYDEVTYCTVCKNAVKTTSYVIPMKAHTAAVAVEENRVESTCTVNGSYDSVEYCSVCKTYEMSRNKVELPLAAHTPGEAVMENRVEATCGKDGSYDTVTYCTVCGAESSRIQTVIPATGKHNYTTEVERVEPSCEANGYYVMKCECGATQETPIPTEGHKYEAVVTNPTCTMGGITVNTCSKCGDSYQSDPVPATGHNDTDGDNLCDNPNCDAIVCQHVWSETIQYVWSEDYLHCSAIRTCTLNDQHTETAIATVQTVPQSETTCTTDGVTYYIAIFVEEWIPEPENEESEGVVKVTIPATNHKDTLVQVESKAPTCAEIGYGAYEYCTACDHTTYEEIPPLGHAYEPVVTDPTCSNQGFTTHTCSRCEDSYVDTYVDATGEHIYSDERHYDRRESWKECTGCKGKDDVVARTYNVKIVDYWGNETVREGYTYGQYLWLNYSTSNVLELQYNGWKLVKNGEEVTVPAYEVWESFDIGEDTVDLTVYEDSTPVKVKSGAIMMSVSYDKANSDKTMTVDLFIYVDSLNEAHKPVVKLGETPLTLETIDESIMMYFVSIDLSAQQITQGGDNVKITVNYNDVTVKTIDSVLIAYEEALDTYLQENVGDVAGTAQEEAINAMLNYGKTVQIYFEKTDPNEWGFTGYEPEEIKELADANNNPVAESTKVGDITFTWKGANVKFEEEYSLRYEFELTGLPADVDLAKATAVLTVTYANGSTNEYPVTITSKTKVEDGIEVVVEDRYYATYPVPASDIAKENTTVRMDITLPDGSKVTTSDFKYGMHAFLTYSIYHYTDERDKETGKPYYVSGETNEATREKTSKYVEMLVSLLKLGEAINNVEAMTSNQQ